MSKKNFVTVFSKFKNVDIVKMPGMTSYYLSLVSNKEVNCSIVSPNNDNYFYFDKFRDYFNLVLLEPGNGKETGQELIEDYLENNSAGIDVLNLYHLDFESLSYANIYKKNNPGGKILLELDADERIKEFFEPANRKGILKLTNNFRPRKSKILKSLVRDSDFIAVESASIYEYLIKQNNTKLSEKLFLNPYGINTGELSDNLNHAIKKENIVITVGRIGTAQKNNEMLLDAIRKIKNIGTWKFYFIGPVEKNFKKRIEDFFIENSGLRENVIFTGEINDRKILLEYMQKAKIFCLTSVYESYGIVLTETAFYNCYILSTNTGVAGEVIENMVDGKLVNNSEELAGELELAIGGNIDFDNISKPRKNDYVLRNSWEKTVSELLKKIF